MVRAWSVRGQWLLGTSSDQLSKKRTELRASTYSALTTHNGRNKFTFTALARRACKNTVSASHLTTHGVRTDQHPPSAEINSRFTALASLGYLPLPFHYRTLVVQSTLGTRLRTCTHLQRSSEYEHRTWVARIRTASVRKHGNRTKILRYKHVPRTYHPHSVRHIQPLIPRRVVHVPDSPFATVSVTCFLSAFATSYQYV